ncbi:hypothetical protein B4113_0681 [Geobacillus sp. B4113_201601]|nr:hypothetical protein B4113_0681 [Geobacillus sp. B4113_201601]
MRSFSLSVPRNGPLVNGQAGKEGNERAAANHVEWKGEMWG